MHSMLAFWSFHATTHPLVVIRTLVHAIAYPHTQTEVPFTRSGLPFHSGLSCVELDSD